MALSIDTIKYYNGIFKKCYFGDMQLILSYLKSYTEYRKGVQCHVY